jgi:putative spermidine/putrescine transport system substrate-binding protein
MTVNHKAPAKAPAMEGRMTDYTLNRRQFGAGVAGAALLAGMPAFAQAPALPKAAVAINVIDVAGNLALTQKAFELYAKNKPNLVSKFNFTKAPAPELPGKIKAQQAANRVDIDLVLTGTDALAAGLDQDLWIDLAGKYGAALPKLDGKLLKGAEMMAPLAKGRGMIVSYYPSGPLLEYMPNAVKNVPTTAEELLAWAKANPNKFLYARPANSGPGRTFLMGLPYILGDKDPKDPIAGWDKTWAYLKELGQYIEYYPTGTGATMKELGDGLGHQPARPRRRAEGSQGSVSEGLQLGHRRALYVRAQGRRGRQDRRPARLHELHADAAGAGLHL